jgi:hypothetical protein
MTLNLQKTFNFWQFCENSVESDSVNSLIWAFPLIEAGRSANWRQALARGPVSAAIANADKSGR